MLDKEKIDELLTKLDKFSRNYDLEEYGLPRYPAEWDQLREIVQKWYQPPVELSLRGYLPLEYVTRRNISFREDSKEASLRHLDYVIYIKLTSPTTVNVEVNYKDEQVLSRVKDYPASDLTTYIERMISFCNGHCIGSTPRA